MNKKQIQQTTPYKLIRPNSWKVVLSVAGNCCFPSAYSTDSNEISSQIHTSLPSHLTLAAVFCTFATVDATLTSFLAQETTAHDCQAGHQAAAVLLLLGRRSLLHGRRLLVAHLLGWVSILLGWWAVALLLRRVLSLRRAGCDVLANYSMLICDARCLLAS